MRELRTQESERFEAFFKIVRKAAEEEGCLFFVDCGEGRDFSNEVMEGEDLSGWLIPFEEVDEFEKEFTSMDVSEKWNDKVAFAVWDNTDGEVSISFKSF